MARIRTIKPAFWTNGDLVQVPFEARLLFIGIWNHADDSGFIEYDPEQIKIRVLPSDPVDAGELIDLLVAAGKLEQYTGRDGEPLLRVVKWTEHQRISNPTPSHLEPGAKKRRAIPAAVRRKLAVQHGAKPGDRKHPAGCFYCGMPGTIYWPTLYSGKPSSWVAFSDLHIDHVDAVAAGGDQEDVDNYVLACQLCNNRKGTKAIEVFVSERIEMQGFREPSGRSTQELHTEGKERSGKEKETSESAVPNSDQSDITDVFEHWVAKTWTGRGRRPSLDEKKRSRIRARLKRFSATELKTAIDGFAASPFHNGQQTGVRHLKISTILRDDEQVETGIEKAVAGSNAAAAGDERSAALLAYYAQQRSMDGAA